MSKAIMNSLFSNSQVIRGVGGSESGSREKRGGEGFDE